MIERYFLFFILAATTVAIPGPAVTLTITNSLRYGVRNAFAGILGIAAGTVLIAAVSAAGIGILIINYPAAFAAMKYTGAGYLVFLGAKLWRSSDLTVDVSETAHSGGRSRFVECLLLQLTNPKAIIFFLSIFPQFIHRSAPFFLQFLQLVLTYCMLLIVLHLGYAVMANGARGWLGSSRGRSLLNKAGGAVLVCFAIGLLTTLL